MKTVLLLAVALFVVLFSACQAESDLSSAEVSESSSSVNQAVSGENDLSSGEDKNAPENANPEIFSLGEKLSLEGKEVLSFRYQLLSAQEERELTLTGSDAQNALDSLLQFRLSEQDPENKDPEVGGARRYIIEFTDGEILEIYDVGILSINEAADLYKREGEEQLVLPENSQWTVYQVDLLTGEKTVVESPSQPEETP